LRHRNVAFVLAHASKRRIAAPGPPLRRPASLSLSTKNIAKQGRCRFLRRALLQRLCVLKLAGGGRGQQPIAIFAQAVAQSPRSRPVRPCPCPPRSCIWVTAAAAAVSTPCWKMSRSWAHRRADPSTASTVTARGTRRHSFSVGLVVLVDGLVARCQRSSRSSTCRSLCEPRPS